MYNCLFQNEEQKLPVEVSLSSNSKTKIFWYIADISIKLLISII